jgi:thiol-disulfide isomerase/thioredoxin
MPKKNKRPKPSRLPQYLILGGVLLLAMFVLLIKERSQPEIPASASGSPEVQLEQALKAGKPALAFFHSNNCEQCIIMIHTVEQVYPEFRDSIALVDINVYDRNNEPLMGKVGLQYIPTLIFFDQYGQGQTHVGVMAVEVLRQRLASLSEAQ